jgi:hypothetical protein
LKKLWGMPMSLLVPVMLVTTVLCKASGALGLLFVGLSTLFWVKWTRTAVALLVLLALPPVYMYQRTSMNWDGEFFKEMAYSYFGEERGQSFATRIDAENLVTARAFEAPSPWFGRGKWEKDDPSRAPWRIYQEMTKWDAMKGEYTVLKDAAATDGLWIITLGQYGIMALLGLTTMLLTPLVVLWIRVPLKFWAHPMVASAAAIAVLVAISMTDNLLNGMINPIFILGAGGLCGIGPSVRKWARKQGAQLPVAGATSGGATPAGYAMPGLMPPQSAQLAGGFRKSKTPAVEVNAAFPTGIMGTPMQRPRR